MALFQTFSVVVGTIAPLPTGADRLGELQTVIVAPVWPRSLYLDKVWMRVSFHTFLRILAMLDSRSIVRFLLVIPKIFRHLSNVACRRGRNTRIAALMTPSRILDVGFFGNSVLMQVTSLGLLCSAPKILELGGSSPQRIQDLPSKCNSLHTRLTV